MLKQVAKGVWIHESEFIKSHAVVVQGDAGVLLIDAGISDKEMESIADDISKMGQTVVMGFSTHSHWDHVLWNAKFGNAPRYGTADCAAEIKTFLSNSDWKKEIVNELPPEDEIKVPLTLLGEITGLPAGAKQIPWDGPKIRIIEHNGHASGHAALLIEDSKVLVVGDMLSDVLIPMFNFASADPLNDYLAGLKLIENVADDVDIFIPGHGSIGDGKELRARIKLDREYTQALLDGKDPKDDPRISSPQKGYEWMADVHNGQLYQLAQKSTHAGKSK